MGKPDLKKKLISLIIAVVMIVSGMYVENINVDSFFACSNTAEQNFMQAEHLTRPSESCTEELLGNRETGSITAVYRKITERTEQPESILPVWTSVLQEQFADDSIACDFRKERNMHDSQSTMINYIHHQDGAKG